MHNDYDLLMMKATLYFDGSTLPKNPGACTAGAVLLIGDNKHEYTQVLGEGTNNTAEYAGLILGLTKAIEAGVTELDIYGDSELVVKCVNDVWGTKNAHLSVFIQYARALLTQFDAWTLSWVPRKQNIADAMTRVKPKEAPKLEGVKLDASRFDKAKKIRVRY